MAIPRFDEDLAIISKLGDNPGSDNNLTTDAFRAKFDEGPLKIQKYLNDVLIPAAEQSSSPQEGLNMEGSINMNGQPLTGLKAPEADNDAATKKYAETYADSLHFIKRVTLAASGWSGSAPYTQTVAVDGILETDVPHYGVVYSANTTTALAEKEAFAMVDDLDTADGSVTFTCFEEKPEVNLTIQMEVNRGAESYGVRPISPLLLDDDETGYGVRAVVGDEVYGVGNATLNSGATGETYDFTVL